MSNSDVAKDSIAIGAGVINAALPSWVSLVPQAADAIEASLRVAVGVATLAFLIFRTIYYRRKIKLLNKSNAQEDNDE